MPCEAAKPMAVSLPMTCTATIVTASHCVGLTLPGMMEDPGCIRGRFISWKPVRGPEDNNRKSLQIFDIFTAVLFRTPDVCT